MNNLLVTIGLPVCNAAPYLADAIQSIINQSFKDWELLIIDDGSTDDSLAIARSFTDHRIRILNDGQNLGLPARLNQITQFAQGEFIARMDADDIMVPHRLQTQMAYFEQYPDVDVVSSYIYAIDVQDKVYGIRGSNKLPQTLEEAVWGVPIAHSTVIARRKWFLENPYNPTNSRGEDIELWLSTIETSKFWVIDQPLLFYRELGLPYVQKYLRTSMHNRSLIKSYHGQLSQQKIITILLLSYLKDTIYKAFSFVNKEDWLLLRRNRPLLIQDQIVAEKLLLQSIVK